MKLSEPQMSLLPSHLLGPRGNGDPKPKCELSVFGPSSSDLEFQGRGSELVHGELRRLELLQLRSLGPWGLELSAQPDIPEP